MAPFRLNAALKRLRWTRAAQRTPFAKLYSAALPSGKTPVSEQNFLVLDCEMSGLNAEKNELLSIGWVQIRGLRIDYSTRRHILLHSNQEVGDSIKIHGLYNSQLAGAASPSKALSLLAAHSEENVLVFHHAALDLAFLNKCALQRFACPLLLPYVDTMMIEKRRLDRQAKTASLQLSLCRDRYGLPAAFAHNAMFDAVATAELFMAQLAHFNGPMTLSELYPKV